MCQLLTDVDMDTMNDGRIQGHLNEFSWDVLKCILRGMELIYRSTDMAVVIKGALRRLFGSPLFIEPLSDEEALITKLDLDMMKFDFPSPKKILSRKREDPLSKSRRYPTKKKEQAIDPELNSEPQITNKEEANVEVNFPPGRILLQSKKLGVQTMRQLLTDVDMDTMNNGRIQGHLDEFSWDGLKRLFGCPLFVEPLSDEEALITKLALDMMKIDFPSPKEILSRKWEE
ncbi:hypothetical protein TIFTF001_052291 [Ficus carica]|uniref:Uncharacterized protein n=2 Tax=Ficus carica TaxID=3494 RepID=A0AA88ELI1_FICCA|nr:hypothetical protein TIFTF001_052287 [Ficus carica]GMN73978.1 hypothetical protein TIFTF001_052291 [Ficus carica]